MVNVQCKCAVANTGPMISVLQSEQKELFRTMYDRICIPSSALVEYKSHGAGVLMEEFIRVEFVVVYELTEAEKQVAREVSEEIAKNPLTEVREPQAHYPESEAIVLMNRAGLGAVEIILDERAAREVAKDRGLPVVGFAGVLVRACREGHVTPEQVQEALLKCQSSGTHYATKFIREIYRHLKGE